MFDLLAGSWPSSSEGAPYALIGLVAGVVSGTFQSRQLRGILNRPWRWIVATSVGTTLIAEVVFLTAVRSGLPSWYLEFRRRMPLDGSVFPEWALAAAARR